MNKVTKPLYTMHRALKCDLNDALFRTKGTGTVGSEMLWR